MAMYATPDVGVTQIFSVLCVAPTVCHTFLRVMLDVVKEQKFPMPR